jgi:hypothetical protein
MGTWGTAITSDDTVADVVGTVIERMKAGEEINDACKFVLREFKAALSDRDDAPLVWLAIADVQWKYGNVDQFVLERIQEDIATEKGLERWRDDPSDFEKRKRVLRAFLGKISIANPKPSAPPRAVVRVAPFIDGHCLAIQTLNGEYTAAIVLATDNSRSEYGSNLVGSLDYLAPLAPSLADFEERKWLFKHHGNWKGEQEIAWYTPVGLRSEKKRISIIGTTVLRSKDPRQSNTYSGWARIGEQILLCRAQNREA